MPAPMTAAAAIATPTTGTVAMPGLTTITAAIATPTTGIATTPVLTTATAATAASAAVTVAMPALTTVAASAQAPTILNLWPFRFQWLPHNQETIQNKIRIHCEDEERGDGTFGIEPLVEEDAGKAWQPPLPASHPGAPGRWWLQRTRPKHSAK